MMTIAVDFDGTIVQHCFPSIGLTIGRSIEILKKFKKEFGCRLILWTCREPNAGLPEAVEFCREQGLEFDAVNKSLSLSKLGRSKVLADLVIDDRGAGRAGASLKEFGDMTPEEWDRIDQWVTARCRKLLEDYELLTRISNVPYVDKGNNDNGS